MKYLILLLKGVGVGAANVIPGVSGGTIALITNIFEPLIEAIKSLNIKAVKLLLSGQFKAFSEHIKLDFLTAVFLGVGLSIITFARLLDYLFVNYPVYTWAYFFGLILASVIFVGRTITRWNLSVIIAFLIGTGIAVLVAFMPIAGENASFWYLFLCGVVAVCSMILPGLSGSFVLILMGNYKLVMIDAVNNMDFGILLPVALGAVIGLTAFSYFLSWILKSFKDQTLATLTGFILGSLSILWPWKHTITQTFGEKIKIVGYEHFIPEHFNTEVILAIVYMLLGVVSIWVIEKAADKKTTK
jgi:putative membrane protein